MSGIRIGLVISPVESETVLKLSLLAERSGFDSLWIPDHIISRSYYRTNSDCWTMITAVACSTSRVTVASAVTDPYRRHPCQLAQTVATLDAMFPGRIALGLGAGEAMNLVPFGLSPPQPLTQTREAVECIKRLWTTTPDEPASYSGRYYRLKDAFLTIKPSQKPHPPIYLGVMGSRARELVGELADGWYPLLTTPQTYTEDLGDIERGASKVGRRLEEIDCVARAQTAVSEDGEKAREAARRAARVWLTLEPHFAKRLDPGLSLDEGLDLRRAVVSSDFPSRIDRIGGAIPDEAADRVCAAGKPDDCIDALEEYIKRGARHIVVGNAGPDLEANITLYGSKVIPYLRQHHD